MLRMSTSSSSAFQVLSKLADGTYKLGGGGEEKLSKSVWVLPLSLGFAAVLLAEKVDDGDSPCVECDQ